MQVELTLHLPLPISDYAVTACECDYCAANNIALLSAQALVPISTSPTGGSILAISPHDSSSQTKPSHNIQPNNGLLSVNSTISLTRTKFETDKSSFVSCPNCEQVIVSSLLEDDNLFGAVNVECLTTSDINSLMKAKPVNTHCLSSVTSLNKLDTARQSHLMQLSINEPD